MRDERAPEARQRNRLTEERRKRRIAEHRAKLAAKTPPRELPTQGSPQLGEAALSHKTPEAEKGYYGARRAEARERKTVLRFGSAYAAARAQVRDRR